MPDNFTCLLWGSPGSGKTTMASTAPPPIFLIDVDNKASMMHNLFPSIEKGDLIIHPITSKLSNEPLKAVTKKIITAGSIKSVVTALPNGYYEICDLLTAIEAGTEVKEVKTIVLDSLTTVSQHLARLICHLACVPQMRLQDWGAFGSVLEELLSFLRSIPKNIIVIAHDTIVQDELTKVIEYLPLIGGRMKHQIGVAFEEIYFLKPIPSKDGVIYQALTQNDGKRIARTSRNLPQFIPATFDSWGKE